MANKYSNYIVNGGGAKPGFRPIFEEQFGCHNIHDLKKQDFIDIALNFDTANAPLSLGDPDIKTTASQAQKDALRAEVDAKRRTRQQEAKAKSGKGTTPGKRKATGQRAQPQKTRTTSAQPTKDEASSSDDEAAGPDRDGDVRMAGDQDDADATKMVGPPADAVSGLHGKRKRNFTATPAANKRIRFTQSKPAEEEERSQEPEDGTELTAVSARPTRARKPAREPTGKRFVQDTPPHDELSSNGSRPDTGHSMIVKLKVDTSRMQAATQVREADGDRNMTLADSNFQSLVVDQTLKQAARVMQTVNAQQEHKKPSSRRPQVVSSPLDLAKSMGNNKDNPGKAAPAAKVMRYGSGLAASYAASRRGLQLPRRPPRASKVKARVTSGSENTALDDVSDESKESTDEEVSEESEESTDDEVEPDKSSCGENIEDNGVDEAPKGGYQLDEYVGSPYDEVEAHRRVCAKTGNLDSTRDPKFDPVFKGTHKVDGYLKIPPLWLAKTFVRNRLNAPEREVCDAQKKE
ncbi:hypothetical protein ACET3X_007880 [Alternaria dauci]|uniref:Inner centromere protein ARK-binding domain-containing protein n=1 Tax=Alternaria dauci TaxID=48095 RepID=A0ABR3UF55_9PLEO